MQVMALPATRLTCPARLRSPALKTPVHSSPSQRTGTKAVLAGTAMI
jgi:hypothetical protein